MLVMAADTFLLDLDPYAGVNMTLSSAWSGS